MGYGGIPTQNEIDFAEQKENKELSGFYDKSKKMPKSGPKVIENALDKIECKKFRDRKLVFTSYDENEPFHEFEEDEKDENQCKYLLYGREICPTTGKKHFQGFCYFFEKVSIAKAKKYLKIKNGWFQYAFCGLKENYDYCTKEGDFTEYGVKPEQGKRKDLNELKDDILNGKSVDDICCEMPVMYHQYGRTLNRIEGIWLRKQYRKWMTKGYWYYGKTGEGKSHKAYEGYHPDTHYIVNLAQLSRGFWTGYKGQPTVIINEFRGQCPYGELLDLVDKNAKNVDWKCGEPVPFLCKTLIITAPHRPENTYTDLHDKEGNIDQLLRRFEVIEVRFEYEGLASINL